MNKPFSVCFNGTPLTLPIVDENRAMLAYNMIYSMAEDGVQFSVDGKQVNFTEADVSVVDSAGSLIYPPLDAEWWASFERSIPIVEEIKRQRQAGDLTMYEVACHEDINMITFLPAT